MTPVPRKPLPPFSRLVLSSGNIMRDGASAATLYTANGLRGSPNEVCAVLEDTLILNEKQCGSWQLDESSGVIYAPDCSQPCSSGEGLLTDTITSATSEEEYQTIDVSAKLFALSGALMPGFDAGKDVEFALDTLRKQLGLRVDARSMASIVVSVDGIAFDELDDEGRQAISSTSWVGLLSIWKTLEDITAARHFRALGVSELTLASLKRFTSQVKTPPKINHINVQDCCIFPTPLVEYAKAHRIDLLTHGDANNILPDEAFIALVGRHGLLPEGDLIPRWVIKYSVINTSRNVVPNKGYIVIADALP